MFDALLKSRNLVPLNDIAGFPTHGQDCFLLRAANDQGTVFVLRHPRNKEKARLIQREVLILQHNAGLFPFAVPAAEWEEDCMIYPELPGRPAITTTKEGRPHWHVDAMSEGFLSSWARALVHLHNNESFFTLPFSSSFPAGRETPPRQDFLNKLRFVREKKACPESELRQWKNWAEHTRWPETAVPIHGDMHAGNILVDSTGSVTGLIDWTRTGWGDGAQDFIFHYLGFGEPGLEQLLDAYSREGGCTYTGMKEHIIGLWNAYPLYQAFFRCLEEELRSTRH